MLKVGVVAKCADFDEVIRRTVYFADLYLSEVTDLFDVVCCHFVDGLL